MLPSLWLQGYSFVGAGSLPPLRGKPLPSTYILDTYYIKKGIPGCGTVTWYTRYAFKGVVEILKALKRGELALVFADGFFNRPNKEIARHFGHVSAEYRPARIPVKFLGRTIQANTWVPWLCLESGAPLFPVKLLRKKGGRFQLVIEPALDLSGERDLQSATAALYRALERDVYLHMPAWNYWSRLHEFSAAA